MTRLSRLPTLAHTNAVPHATRKCDLPTKLDRAIANKAARLKDVQQLRAWARAVKDRDQWKDQRTGVRVLSTRSLDPLRAEAHHIEPKENRAVRYDVRNGVTLSLATHLAVEQHHYRIDGTVFFTVRGAATSMATSR